MSVSLDTRSSRNRRFFIASILRHFDRVNNDLRHGIPCSFKSVPDEKLAGSGEEVMRNLSCPANLGAQSGE